MICPHCGKSIENDAAAIERRCLAGAPSILVCVPTLIPREEINAKGLACLEGWGLPGTFIHRISIANGRSTADCYEAAASFALRENMTHMLTVEDDHLIPPGAFERLWRVHQDNPRSIVGAWYPQKREPRTGAAIIETERGREFLTDDGAIHEVFVCPMGFTLFPLEVFRQAERPWFLTTDRVTQDAFFSQRAREAGYQLLVDTSTRIKHVCRETGKIYS